jgi:alpha-L-rhamnosidase
MYAAVAGIDLDPQQPGYKHIVMRPRPGGELTSASAELRSIYGPIRSAWKLENGGFDWQIRVPANTTATVYVPAGAGASVREGDAPAGEASGVRFLRHEAGASVYEVGAGAYHFTADKLELAATQSKVAAPLR